MRRSNRKRIPLIKERIEENKRKEKSYKNKKKYGLKQKELFFEEYIIICKKYGCFITGEFISKQERGEKIWTIRSHLSGISCSYSLNPNLI